MRTILAVFFGKFIYFFTRAFKIGGGAAAPGYYALKIDPNLVQTLASQLTQQVVITGTNGKTTTARLLDQFVKSNNLKTLRNSTGSNLERGIASALIEKTNFFGQIKNVDLAIWELDEAAFNKVVFQLKPQIIVFLNAFRDQLDRYGEVDSVIKKWQDSLIKIDWITQILINESDPNITHLGDFSKKNTNITTSYFTVQGVSIFHEVLVNKTSAPHKPDFQAKIIKKLGLNGFKLEVNYPQGQLNLNLAIPGAYHIFDLMGALSAYYQLNLSLDQLQASLDKFDPAFGRVEKLKIGEKEVYIFLIKNPAGTNAVLETIAEELTHQDELLIVLNDNFADGTDVSWIWDSNWEVISNQKSVVRITCSGTRAEDMALRLKYAGLNTNNIEVNQDLTKVLESREAKRLFILPTYTALLELQKILAVKGYKTHYWKN